MDVKKIAKTAISYSSGYAGLKAGTDTMREAAKIPLGGIKYVANYIRESQEEARLDRELLRTKGGKEIWLQMVSDYGITTDSVRKSYRQVIAVNYLLLIVMASFIGYWVAMDSNSIAVNFACFVYFWMNFLFIFLSAYRGHIAYSQCIPSPLSFIGYILRNPLNLIVKNLPDDYKVKGV
ncbi:TPA: hypothetical protein L5C23_005805 [Pseudomonas aeruginosa]|uniref:hypothetical protein n=1 Tax=Pseudomonas aeruginosa TaxID=287 RepID=UPI00117BDDD1|nr:hypothetical protein [Pseudomonas aeruginosa]HBO8188568.1 hypothetical protein [Pseudomonas aeruginosa]